MNSLSSRDTLPEFLAAKAGAASDTQLVAAALGGIAVRVGRAAAATLGLAAGALLMMMVLAKTIGRIIS